MKKKKLGYMHWFFALLLWFLAHLIAYALLTLVLPFGLVYLPIPSRAYVFLALNFLLYRARDCIWYMLTYRRYCASKHYAGICLLHVIWIGLSSFANIGDWSFPRPVQFLYCGVNIAIAVWTLIHVSNLQIKEARAISSEESAQ